MYSSLIYAINEMLVIEEAANKEAFARAIADLPSCWQGLC